jgi:uncharacterized membrane protein
VAGLLMIAMALVAGFGLVKGGKAALPAEEERRASAARLGHKLLMPALAIPVVTMLGSTLLKDVQHRRAPLLDPKNLTLVSMGCGSMWRSALACWLTRATPAAGRARGAPPDRRDELGGGAAAHAGRARPAVFRGRRRQGRGPHHDLLHRDGFAPGGGAAFCIGMALFTVVMGNGFAAFPVIAGGIGIPVLVGVYHANPAVMAAIGMFSAYCGTLMTPMAANFNIVPAALLELPTRTP